MIADMDTADALDMLRELPEEKKQTLAAHLDDDTRKDVRRLLAFHQEEIGSRMSGNFVCIPDTLTVCGAMNELVRQAGEHDNISTLYVVDGSGVFAGAIDLKDLIIARENDPLSGIIRRSYPYVLAHEKVEDCIDRIAEYEEDSLPVLTEDGRIAGILTAQDLVELVDDAMGDDYAKLGGLTSEEDLREPAAVSMKSVCRGSSCCCFWAWASRRWWASSSPWWRCCPSSSASSRWCWIWRATSAPSRWPSPFVSSWTRTLP